MCSFFFHAKEGIRYACVCGVQTCALPILCVCVCVCVCLYVCVCVCVCKGGGGMSGVYGSLGVLEWAAGVLRGTHHIHQGPRGWHPAQPGCCRQSHAPGHRGSRGRGVCGWAEV